MNMLCGTALHCVPCRTQLQLTNLIVQSIALQCKCMEKHRLARGEVAFEHNRL